jgi:hypothetical protein
MTDLDEAGLRNQVKVCRTKRTYVYPDHEWVMYTDDTFSPEGNLLERHHRNPRGSEWSITCRYDEQGRILEKMQAGEMQVVQRRFSYHYDPSWRLAQVMLHSHEEGERVFESVRYAADGIRSTTLYPTPLDENQRNTTSVDGESMLHFWVDAVAIMTVFDANDRPVRKVLYDIDDRVIRRVGFRYDARGLLLEEGELIGGSVREDLRKIYRYDASGQLIESESRWSDHGGRRRTFTYNNRGDISQEIVSQHGGLIWKDDGIQVSTQRFIYRYDDHENWIERTTTTSSSGKARISMIEHRDLAYHL